MARTTEADIPRDEELGTEDDRSNSYGSEPGFEYPSRTQERQLIEEAEHAKSSEVREAILTELADRRARFQVEYEQERQWAIGAGREPLSIDPFDPRHRWDKYGQWLAENYGTEQERNLDPRRFEYSTNADMYSRERDMVDRQRRLVELNESTGNLEISKEEIIKAKKEAGIEGEDSAIREFMKTREWKDSIRKLEEENLPQGIRTTRELIESGKRPPTGRTRYPLVERTPGPDLPGGSPSYFDTYVFDPGVTSPEEQSEINYQKLLNPKPKPSKGGKFVPIDGSLPEPTEAPWREATASQINDRLNKMPDDQATKIRTALGL